MEVTPGERGFGFVLNILLEDEVDGPQSLVASWRVPPWKAVPAGVCVYDLSCPCKSRESRLGNTPGNLQGEEELAVSLASPLLQAQGCPVRVGLHV